MKFCFENVRTFFDSDEFNDIYFLEFAAECRCVTSLLSPIAVLREVSRWESK